MTDHQRPLNKRGRSDAPRIADALERLGWWPSLVLSSDSRRTWETFQRMNERWSDDARLETLRAFYLGGVDEIRAELAMLTSECGIAMALGHNPGWEEAVYWLSGIDEKLTTANAALLSHDGDDWASATQAPQQWELHQVLRPRELADDNRDPVLI